MSLRRRATLVGAVAISGVAVWLLTAIINSSASSAGEPTATLEHFKCYGLDPAPFDARDALLRDQFGEHTATVEQRVALCNPVNKNHEGLENRRAHEVCYTISGDPVDVDVLVRNQFGEQQLHVNRPRLLCLPSQKRKLDRPTLPRIRQPIDHFQCYDVREGTTLDPGRVHLRDQFGAERVRVGPAIALCNPTSKDGGEIIDRTTHGVCYALRPRETAVGVEIRNQYEQAFLRTNYSAALCVPSTKTVLPG